MVLLWLVGCSVVYALIAGCVYRALGAPQFRSGTHGRRRGDNYFDCDAGMFSFDFEMCAECRRARKAVRTAWLWPLAALLWPACVAFRLAADVTARPTSPADAEQRVPEPRP